MYHVKQDHQWAIGVMFPEPAWEIAGWGESLRVGKGPETYLEGRREGTERLPFLGQK